MVSLEELDAYKKKHPEYFPEGTPIEKQLGVLQVIMEKQEAEKQRAREDAQKQDDKTEAAQREREIHKQGQDIYQAGKFIQYCKENFQKIWYGDAHILEAVLYIGATFHLDNADEPIHLHVAGTTQSGKSDSVKTALKFIHPDDQLTITFSPKWIFYATASVHENLILFSDDTVLDTEVAALFRNILTSWHDGVKRGIVSERTALTQEVPRHVSLILTAIESVCEESADGQDESRFLTMEIRRTRYDESRIREFIQQKKPDITPEIEIILGVWKSIPTKEITLHKKFDMEIPNRDFKRFLTLVKCHALLCSRDTTSDEDVDAIQKFLTYSKPMVDSQTEAYTREEKSIIDVLRDGRQRSPNQIANETGLPYQKVMRGLRGRDGTFDKPYGGLLRKLPTARIRYDVDLHEHRVWMELT